MATAFDPFAALGLPRDASRSTIKARYHALARKYHPNRHQGNDCSKTNLSEAFHTIHEAWKLLSKADNRKRRAELLKLLDLQNEIVASCEDLLNASASPDGEEHAEHHGSDYDGHISSDADEDLPNIGLQRRQTILSKGSRGLRRLGDRADSVGSASSSSPSKRGSKWQILKDKAMNKPEIVKEADYFMARRKKLTKLRSEELEAFEDYRDAMVLKFEAEEEAERQQEIYERAKWKREYFERAPRPTTERMRSFLNAMGAVTAFERHTPRPRNRSTLSYSTMSPIVGPSEGPQFLFPDHGVSRQKSMHKRGWSSDISGDQTSSSDDSGDARISRTMSPRGHWHHYSKRSRITHAGNHWTFPSDSSTDSATDRRHSVEFQLVVRQPTELGTITEGQDSSGDAPTGTSRTPSPQPDNVFNSELFKFTMLPTSTIATIFGMQPMERRARSPSPAGHRRQSSLTKITHNQEIPSSNIDGCQLTIERLVAPRHHQVPVAHVHLLSRHEKAGLLGAEADTHAIRPDMLLERLRRFSPDVATKFEVKPDMEEVFNFRLIYGSRDGIPTQHQSYIALSYRRKIHVEREGDHYTLPLEPEIFQAVWDERQSDTEGVWIDQICIRQEDDEERTISMSAMDMVYRGARMVVVALDDIVLDANEGARLQNHIIEYNSLNHVSPRQRFRHKQPPYLEAHEDLYRIIRKILGSSWFKRAWCRHEMRLAKHHTFLIPTRRKGVELNRDTPGSDSGIDVLKFNSKSLAHLLDLATEVPWESEVESVKPALHAFFRDRSKMSPDEREMHAHHGNFSTVVAEVFAMEAGGNPLVPAEVRMSDARKDKIAIILNTMECGLALERRHRVDGFYGTDNECFHDLSLLALAAGDPGVLCSVGAPLPITDSSSSWLYIPTVADAGLNETKTLNRLPDHTRIVTNTSGDDQFIQLDLKFLPRGHRPRSEPENDFLPRPGSRSQTGQSVLDVARQFMNACEDRKWGRNRKRYLTHDRTANRLFGSMKEMYVKTLECVLQLGPDWMSDVCQRYSMSRWKVYLQGAYELLIALKNTNGTWPVETWDARSAGYIMDFVNFLVIRGLPTRQIKIPEPWRPLWVDRHGVKLLTFAPDLSGPVFPAIPRALIHTDYVHLARLWILQPRYEHNEGNDAVQNISEWTLLGKSVLFSDENTIGKMTAYGGDLKDQQKVYGRRRNMMPNGTGRRDVCGE